MNDRIQLHDIVFINILGNGISKIDQNSKVTIYFLLSKFLESLACGMLHLVS